MAKPDRVASRSDDRPTRIDSKTTCTCTVCGPPTPRYHALTIRITHRGPLRLLRSRPAQRLICLILALAGLQLYLLHAEYHSALVAKYSPTLFTRLPPRDQDLLGSTRWQVATDSHNLNQGRQQLLDSRDQWKRLGSGCEGDTFSFNSSVIKVFKPGRSPLRNCVPNTAPDNNLRWPSEVPVSLLLGGLSGRHDGANGISDRADFLPVHDYFLLPAGDSTAGPGQWHLVTPFLEAGTLEQLARRQQQQQQQQHNNSASHMQTAQQVDSRYRPSFNRLLKALSTMHSQHDLCHDDIKMDNIFVADGGPPGAGDEAAHTHTHWLLADLGNARQPGHSYHSSLLWAHDNGQNADCRVNDVVRLTKSYLLFLRSAVAAGAPRDAFDGAFLAASAPWSRLYWHTVNSARGRLDGAAAARQVLAASTGALAPGGAAAQLELPQPPAQDTGGRAGAGDDDGWGVLDQPTLALQRASWSEWIWPRPGGGPTGEGEEAAALVSQHLRTGLRASERWAKIYGTFGILPIPSQQC